MHSTTYFPNQGGARSIKSTYEICSAIKERVRDRKTKQLGWINRGRQEVDFDVGQHVWLYPHDGNKNVQVAYPGKVGRKNRHKQYEILMDDEKVYVAHQDQLRHQEASDSEDEGNVDASIKVVNLHDRYSSQSLIGHITWDEENEREQS